MLLCIGEVGLMRFIRNNKGLSLVELVVGIALFAIVVTPVMNSFITSSQINQKARKLMIANDVAQNVMEGYSDKTYEVVKECIGIGNTGNLSGTSAFTTINGGVYNLQSNFVDLTGNTTMNSKFTAITQTGCTFNSVPFVAIDNVSPNSVTFQMNQVFEGVVTGDSNFTADGKKTFACVIPSDTTDDSIIFMAYTNLEGDNGYKFNATVLMFPSADASPSYVAPSATAIQKYYPYTIKITLYDADDTAGGNFGDPMLTVLGGIASL